VSFIIGVEVRKGEVTGTKGEKKPRGWNLAPLYGDPLKEKGGERGKQVLLAATPLSLRMAQRGEGG